jgi:hypothetical protein
VVWKNEVMTEIGDPGAYTSKMAVSKNKIYVVGELTSDDSDVIWENGVMTPITAEGVSISRVYDMKIKNGNLYILAKDGMTGNSILFKNGELQAPFDGTFEGELNSIALR